MATTLCFYAIALCAAALILRQYERTRSAAMAAMHDVQACSPLNRHDWSFATPASPEPMAEWDRVTTRYTGAWVRSRLMRCGVRERDVEDLCQEVLLEAHQRLSGCKPRKSPVSLRRWLASLVRKKAMDHCNKLQPAPVVLPELEAAAVDPGSSPEEQAIAAEMQSKWLTALKPKLRAVMQAHLQGVSAGDMAIRLGVPVGTVSTRLRLAREKILQALHREHVRQQGA